jgi:hypothetical protein
LTGGALEQRTFSGSSLQAGFSKKGLASQQQLNRLEVKVVQSEMPAKKLLWAWDRFWFLLSVTHGSARVVGFNKGSLDAMLIGRFVCSSS